MDFLTEVWTAWNEQLGATIATIVAVIALLKTMGKNIRQLGSTVWRWKGWTIVSRPYRRANTLYRVRKARGVMRRVLKGGLVIEMQVYDNCLRENPGKSTRGQLKEITPAKPSWLNDYYVATALESLSNEGSAVKAERYSIDSWPPKPVAYIFGAITADRSASEEGIRIETNSKCLAYQSFAFCPRAFRFEPQHVAETVSHQRDKI